MFYHCKMYEMKCQDFDNKFRFWAHKEWEKCLIPNVEHIIPHEVCNKAMSPTGPLDLQLTIVRTTWPPSGTTYISYFSVSRVKQPLLRSSMDKSTQLPLRNLPWAIMRVHITNRKIQLIKGKFIHICMSTN